MFLTWVLGDNTNLVKAPILWIDVANAYHPFLHLSIARPSVLEIRTWWTDISGTDKAIPTLKGVFRCPRLFEMMLILGKIPCFALDTRQFWALWCKGMQNVGFPSFYSFVVCYQYIFYLQFWAAALEICLWQLMSLFNPNNDDSTTLDTFQNWTAITSKALPSSIQSKDPTFDDIKASLDDPRSHKSSWVVKSEVAWELNQFEACQEVPQAFPGSILQPVPADKWTFEPDTVSIYI